MKIRHETEAAKNGHPPKIPGWLIKISAWFDDGFAAYGDVCEEYYEIFKSRGRYSANLWFWRQCIRTFPVFIKDYLIWRMIMFNNYLKVALRNIKKQKGYALINISGLAIGMAACIMILLWVQDELGFDKYHENADRIYRVTIDANLGTQMKAPVSPTPAGPAMVAEYPEVLQYVRFDNPNRSPVVVGDKEYFEDNVAFADNSVFDVFSFPLLRGDPKTALKTAYTAVITEDTARKYFGDEDPVGRMIRFGGEKEYAVTGVVKNVPANSHFTFNILRSMETRYVENRREMENWMAVSQYTYLLLDKNADPHVLEQKLPALIEKNLGPVLKSIGASITLHLQPLRKIHLYSDFAGDIGTQGGILYVYLFSAIALFVLLIACINFINLSTARSATRAQEVGMRKTLGAVRHRLVGQFLGESVVYSLLSLFFAVVLILAAIPWFNSVVGRGLGLNILKMPWLIPAFVGIALVVGIIAGSYPAFFLSSFQPVRVLRGKLKFGTKNIRFRRILVIVQFAISIVLIIGTMMIYKQLLFMKSKNLGFDKEHVVVLPGLDDVMEQSYQTLRNEFKSLPGVISIGASSMIPGRGIRRSAFQPEGFSQDQSQTMDYLDIDPDFFAALGIQVAKGRNFSEDLATDRSESVIINETAAKNFGWDDPVGKQFIFAPDQNSENREVRMNVIGVVKDYHNTSLRLKIDPMILFYDPSGFSDFALRIGPKNIPRTVSLIKDKWKELLPQKPFDYFFLDDSFDSQYRAEEQMGNLTLRFSLLAIFIGCLGLFGMASYTTEQRTKEIGIRKVLGASAGAVVRMLSKEYIVLVAIGNLIAWPAAYFMMKSWLDNFAYRTSLAFWIFLAAALLSLAVALLTVSYQSIRAALSNPVDSLRYE
ncbi:MAG: ABC transporter permease [Candidatus Aminicenantes bacterium]|nr:ABC transporter permease [Candidatus Aminicenantes bacterium]